MKTIIVVVLLIVGILFFSFIIAKIVTLSVLITKDKYEQIKKGNN